jgi:hypothetical protein
MVIRTAVRAGNGSEARFVAGRPVRFMVPQVQGKDAHYHDGVTGKGVCLCQGKETRFK